ncbi:MAG: hypothetical protein IJC52_04865 [Clostridia bacterium]|nr:hypothetical protein [Clostridia bacterium]
MKKAFTVGVAVLLTVLMILVVPVPRGSLDDGGTREYIALTYRIVDWNKIIPSGVYEQRRVYGPADRGKSIDELWALELERETASFNAVITEFHDGSVTVQPFEGEPEANSADRITFSTVSLPDIGAAVGMAIEVFYSGEIMETYPAQIHAYSWRGATDLRRMTYDEPWIDKAAVEPCEYDDIFTDIVITSIYADCFFAQTVIPMPYTIKMNGTLSEDWCVGDQVAVTYENTYYDDEANRVEADLLTIEQSTFSPDPMVAYKPVIYLYPEETTDVSVTLDVDGARTCTYPAYKDGWRVSAAPDGTLTDERGQTYNYLYWEGNLDADFDRTHGVCIKGEDTAAYLETALAQLGLTRREANEFIVYWLPLMEQNPYNLITFQTSAYTEAARLHVTPTPDTLIRVFMTWQASDTYVALTPQTFQTPARDGFTVVEWGGAQQH